jgi:transposase
VKAYVKRGKSDVLDAEAICEAVQRPTMRFAPVKTVEQQGIFMTHRARSLLVRQRTMLANALRANLAGFGLVTNPGIANLAKLAEQALSMPMRCPLMLAHLWRFLSARSWHFRVRSSTSMGVD